MIDVDDLVEDPDFAQPMTVYRRKYTTGANYIIGLVTPNPWGSIQSGANPELVRGSDFAVAGNLITIHTKFPLLEEGSTFGYTQNIEAKAVTDAYGNQILPDGVTKFKSDIVMWHGDPYEIFLVQDWQDYGTGFISALARKVAMSETGSTMDDYYSVDYSVSGLNFTFAQNSQYTGLPL